MVSTIFGFFGSLVGLVATVIAASAGITFFIVLWKSGALPETIGLVGTFINGVIAAVAGFFGFLRDLISFASS
jgi:hypothetical protein